MESHISETQKIIFPIGLSAVWFILNTYHLYLAQSCCNYSQNITYQTKIITNTSGWLLQPCSLVERTGVFSVFLWVLQFSFQYLCNITDMKSVNLTTLKNYKELVTIELSISGQTFSIFRVRCVCVLQTYTEVAHSCQLAAAWNQHVSQFTEWS